VISPVAAAAAVAGIAVLLATLTPPGARHSHHQGPASSLAGKSDPKFIIAEPFGFMPLQVRSAATGAIVAQIHLPRVTLRPGGSPSRYVSISAVATANGRSYIIALYRPQPCRSWLYQFTLSSDGQPSALTPLTGLPTVPGAAIYNMDISGDGQWLAFVSASSGAICARARPGPTRIGFTNIGTGQTKQWTILASTGIDDVSLSADGGLLVYDMQLNAGGVHPGPSEVRVLPTSTPPGNAAALGNAIVKSAQFGPGKWITFAAITPNGQRAYFSVYPPGGGGPGQIWATNLAGGPAHLIAANAQYPGLITADPRVRHLLMYIDNHFSKLTLATGKVTVMPRAWRGFSGSVFW
jgi:hypothetical protein